MPTKGRPPLLPHQLGPHGKAPREGPVIDTQEIPIIREKDRKRFGVPKMPAEFNGKNAHDRRLKAIWMEHIAPCPWLVRADTASCVMFCILWSRCTEKGVRNASAKNIAKVYKYQVELGLTPLSRARMNRKNLPVVESTHHREKRKLKQAEKKRLKAEGKDPAEIAAIGSEDFGAYQ